MLLSHFKCARNNFELAHLKIEEYKMFVLG